MRRRAAALAAAVVLLAACNDDSASEPPKLEGAELVSTLSAEELEGARHVLADGDGGLLIVAGDDRGRGGTLLSVRDGRLVDERSLDTAPDAEPAVGYPTEFAAVTPDGQVVLADRSGGEAWVLGVDEDDDRRLTGVPKVGGVAVTADGTILFADQDDGEIVGHTPGGTTVAVAGTEPGAAIPLDTPLDPPVSLAALPDGQVAVITANAGVRSVRLLGPGPVNELLMTGVEEDEPGPVVATDDGRLLIVQPGQQVTLVDAARPSGGRIVLDGGGDTPIAVTARGDDLMVLHAGRLWRAEGVLAD